MRDVFGIQVDDHLTEESQLWEAATPSGMMTSNKVIDHIDPLARRFIEASSLVILANLRGDRLLDITPRGDPAPVVEVLNPNVIAVAHRPGNGRMDTYKNIFAAGQTAMLFIVPGHRDTLGVSGEAALVRDRTLFKRFEIKGKQPEFVTLLKVERVMAHCPKAFVRDGVWDPDKWPNKSDVPTQGEMLVAHGKLEISTERADEIVHDDRVNNLY